MGDQRTYRVCIITREDQDQLEDEVEGFMRDIAALGHDIQDVKYQVSTLGHTRNHHAMIFYMEFP